MEGDPQLTISTRVDPSGAQTGAAQTVEEMAKIAEATRLAQLEADKLGVSVTQYQKAMATLKAEDERNAFNELVEDLRAAREEADGVVDATGSIGDAAEKTGETGFKKMVGEAGGMRESTRLARELFESLRGGDASISGLSGIARYALISSEALGPGGPIMGALASLGLGFLSVWAMHEAKSGEAKDKVKGDLEESGMDVKSYADIWKTALDEVLKAQEELEKSDARQLAAIKQKSDAEKAVIEVQKEAAIEQARTAYLAKLSPDMSAEDRKKAKDEFDAEKSDITNESEVATAKLAVSTKQAEIAAQQKALADAQADLAALTLQLQQAAEAKVTAANALANQGITLTTDKDGSTKFTDADGNDVMAQSQKKINDLLDEINNKRRVQLNRKEDGQAADPQLDVYIKQLEGQLTSAEQSQDSLILYARDIQNFSAAKEKLNSSIEADKGKVEDATGKLNDATQQLGVLTQKLPVAEQKATNDKKEREADEAMQAYHEAVKKKYDDARAALESKRKDLQTADDNPNLTPEQKAQSKAQIDDLDAQLAQLQLDNSKALDLTQAQKIDLRGEVKSDRQKATYDLQAGAKKEDEQAEKTTGKTLEGLTAEATALVKQSGHPELEADLRGFIEATKDDPTRRILDLLQILAEATAVMHGSNNDRVALLHQELLDLKADVDRLKH